MKSRAVALTERVIALVEAARAKTVAAVNLAMVYTYYEIDARSSRRNRAANVARAMARRCSSTCPRN